jgi:phosphate transport system protein
MVVQRHFDEELRALKERLLTMGSLAERALNRAVAALVERDAGKGAEIREIERQVNAIEIEIDERAFTMLARRQPVASDMRFLVMAIKISSDIERISDLAVNIAQSTERLLEEPPLKRLVLTPVLAERVLRMFRESLDSFVRGDAELARRVIDSDAPVDALRDDLIRSLLTYMMEDPATISRAISVLLITQNLERVADHATNIAEEVIYMVEAREMRHGYHTGKIVGHGEPGERAAPPPPSPAAPERET